MKTLTMMMVMACVVGAGASAALVYRDFSDIHEDTTGAIFGGTAYYYGFNVNPTSSAVNLDGVSGGASGDFSTLNPPDFDLTQGLATNIDGKGAEHLLNTAFTNSIWKAQFTDAEYVIEAKVNILANSSAAEGANGVFALHQQNPIGGRAIFMIGKNIIKQGSTVTPIVMATEMDNTGWHVWTVVRNADGFWLLRDGIQINAAAIAPTPTTSGHSTFAGDYDGTLSGDWQMEYYVLDTIPEPATMSLLGLGALSLLRRKRKA